MAKRILQNTLIARLETQGWVVVEKKTARIVLEKKGEYAKLFVGNSGALRKGPSFTGSISLTNSKFYKQLLQD